MVQIRTLKPLVRISLPTKAPMVKPLQGKTTVRRLIDHPAPTPQPTPCRLWQGTIDNHGYGTWWRKIPDGETYRWLKTRPHRWILEVVLERKLRKNEVVMHLCDNPLCYRADHLEVGTVKQNNHDMMRKGRYKHSTQGIDGWTRKRIQKKYLSGLHQQTIADEEGVKREVVARAVKGIFVPGRGDRNPR